MIIETHVFVKYVPSTDYWSNGVVFCCIYKQSYKYLYLFLQAFEANASSSGGIQTLLDTDTNQDVKIITIESEGYTCKREKVLTPTFKLTIMRRWLETLPAPPAKMSLPSQLVGEIPRWNSKQSTVKFKITLTPTLHTVPLTNFTGVAELNAEVTKNLKWCLSRSTCFPEPHVANLSYIVIMSKGMREKSFNICSNWTIS